MPNVKNSEVREKCRTMNDAWLEGAPGIAFNGISQDQFSKDIEAAATADNEIADIEARLKLKREGRDNLYFALSEKRTKIGQGVVGSPEYGDDSPLYGAMGFVRKSERKSGLTRKKKPV